MARDSRTETIQALDAFLAAQQQLLARQRDDIERLQKLRSDLHERPSGLLSNLSDELDHGTFRLSAQTDLRLVLPPNIDWSVFDKADTSGLSTLASRLPQRPGIPPKTQQSPLSDLQVLVKTAKKDMLDPILESIANSAMALHLDSEDEEEDIDPLERSRFEERMKILELKKRKVRGGGSGLSLLTTRNIVFVRDDLEDETGDVDIDSWGVGEKERNRVREKITCNSSAVERPAKASFEANGRPHTTMRENFCPAAGDEERPKKKAKLLPSTKSRSNTSHSSVVVSAKSSASDIDDDVVNGNIVALQKPKSETYKQAWSIDEQNLLEQLLETIPDGEKYRWSKISRAMGGRRTPRQVASRVQKYFEKLKKFGVAVD